MFKPDLSEVRQRAHGELTAELMRQAVDEEKRRLRAQMNQGLWQRLFDMLPITITWKRKTK